MKMQPYPRAENKTNGCLSHQAPDSGQGSPLWGGFPEERLMSRLSQPCTVKQKETESTAALIRSEHTPQDLDAKKIVPWGPEPASYSNPTQIDIKQGIPRRVTSTML